MFCGKPNINEKKLLRCVQANDIKSIERLIARDRFLLSHTYPHPHDNNILIIACNDNNSMNVVTGETINKLVQLGASCTEPTQNDHWEAIHYAAINANKAKLSAIIQHLTVEEANSLVYCSHHVSKKFPFRLSKTLAKSFSNNALHILLKYGRRSTNFKECCKLLIDKGVSVTQADSNGITPLELLKQEELDDIVEHVTKSKMPQVFRSKPPFDLVNFDQVEEFLSNDFTKEEVDDVDAPNENLSSCTLLQVCCLKGLTPCVKHILDRGANPNKIFKKSHTSPIMIAIREDREEIVQLLLENRHLLLPDDILIRLQLKNENIKNSHKIEKYMKLILEYLLKYDKDKLKNYLFAADELNRTALHYAIHYRCSETVLKLLALGAPLTKKDHFGFSALDSIDPQLLETFLDNCIDIPKDGEDMDNMLFALRNTKEKFSVEINYEALTASNEEKKVYESEFLSQLIKHKKLSFLVNHPVISSYLAVKWEKFKWAVYMNLLMYLIAYASLLFYGFAYNNLAHASNSLLLTALSLLLLQELVQIVLFRLDYLKRVDNLIDLLLIGGIIYIIASGWFETLLNQNLKVAFSVVFMTSTLGIFLQLGHLPFFTIKVIVFRQTTISFCKYMIFYAFPVLAFFFCFYMLRETDENIFFQTLYDVSTMFAGDPQSDYPAQFSTNPVFSHIIYVCFIVLIGIILQNLLIGLAVSDLQEIKKEAKFLDKIERASYISNMERVLFSNLLHSSSNFTDVLFGNILYTLSIFQDQKVLVIEPYNFGRVYVKENPENKQYIQDQNIINLLQNVLKDISLSRDVEMESPYSLKALHEKLQGIENLLQEIKNKINF